VNVTALLVVGLVVSLIGFGISLAVLIWELWH